MTRHIPIAEFKDRLSEMVAAAAKGEEIIITRHGRVEAKLVPANDAARQKRIDEAVRGIRAHQAKMRAERRTSTAAERREWIDEGRR